MKRKYVVVLSAIIALIVVSTSSFYLLTKNNTSGTDTRVTSIDQAIQIQTKAEQDEMRQIEKLSKSLSSLDEVKALEINRFSLWALKLTVETTEDTTFAKQMCEYALGIENIGDASIDLLVSCYQFAYKQGDEALKLSVLNKTSEFIGAQIDESYFGVVSEGKNNGE